MKNIKITKANTAGHKLTMFYEKNDGGTGSEVMSLKKKPCHPDLNNALQAIKPYTLESFYLDEGDDVSVIGVTVNEKKIKKVTTEIAIFTISLTTPSGSKTTLNTENIPLENNYYGYKNLDEKIQTFFDEVYAYFYEGKEAQQNIPFKEQEGDDTN